jgi:hypothetical protein
MAIVPHSSSLNSLQTIMLEANNSKGGDEPCLSFYYNIKGESPEHEITTLMIKRTKIERFVIFHRHFVPPQKANIIPGFFPRFTSFLKTNHNYLEHSTVKIGKLKLGCNNFLLCFDCEGARALCAAEKTNLV